MDQILTEDELIAMDEKHQTEKAMNELEKQCEAWLHDNKKEKEEQRLYEAWLMSSNTPNVEPIDEDKEKEIATDEVIMDDL